MSVFVSLWTSLPCSEAYRCTLPTMPNQCGSLSRSKSCFQSELAKRVPLSAHSGSDSRSTPLRHSLRSTCTSMGVDFSRCVCCGEREKQLDIPLAVFPPVRSTLGQKQLAQPPPIVKKLRNPTALQVLGRSCCCNHAPSTRNSLPAAPCETNPESGPDVPKAVQSASSRTDFTGQWTMTSIVGDMDTFLEDLDATTEVRSFARSSAYGVGWIWMNISQTGNCFTVDKVVAAGKCQHFTFTVGAGDFDTEDLFGLCSFTPVWKGEALEADITIRETQVRFATSMRLVGTCIELEMTSCRETVVKRIFTRDSSPTELDTT